MDAVKFLVKNGLMGDDMPRDLENAACSAAGNGYFDILTFLLELWEKPELPDYIFRSAVETGNLDIVKHVYHSMKWDPFQVKMNTEIAASRGHYDIVAYFCKANGGFEDFGSFEEVSGASKYGHIEVARLVLGISSWCFYFDALAVAAEHGHVELLKYLHRYVQRRRDLQWEDSDSDSIDFDDPYEELEEGEEEEVIRRAIVRSAENGHLEVVQWLCRQHPSHFTHHAFGGHRDVLAFLLERTPLRPTNRAILLAVERGHLTLVHMLGERYSSIVRCRRSAMDEAPVKGLYNLVQSLHIGRLEGFTVKALDGAASNGHLDVVRFLHFYRSEGCTKDAMDGAAANGHFEIVRFLHEKRQEGCTTEAMDNAAGNGYLDIVKFLHAHRKECCAPRAMDNAAADRRLEIVEFLHENRTEGCTTLAMDEAGARGHITIVRFLHENRTEGCTSKAMGMAAANGHLHVVRFLHENRKEGCTAAAMTKAILQGHFDIVKYLKENRTEGYDESVLLEADRQFSPYVGRVIKFLVPDRLLDQASRRTRLSEEWKRKEREQRREEDSMGEVPQAIPLFATGLFPMFFGMVTEDDDDSDDDDD